MLLCCFSPFAANTDIVLSGPAALKETVPQIVAKMPRYSPDRVPFGPEWGVEKWFSNLSPLTVMLLTASGVCVWLSTYVLRNIKTGKQT